MLYYSLISRNLRELIPIIYTPTEVSLSILPFSRCDANLVYKADAIANYSHLFRRSEGLYLSFPNEDTMEEEYLEQTQNRDIDLIVCSDAEAILGIGDQGVGVRHFSTTSNVNILTLILRESE